MAFSAFKSTSRRPNLSTSSTKSASSDKETKKQSPKTVPPRRSKSVSAFPRTQPQASTSSPADFFKRDNPLFSISDSPPPDLTAPNSKAPAPDDANTRRGRSVSRNADMPKTTSGIDRSLSRSATGRRFRSVSRLPGSRTHNLNSEGEVEQDDSLSETTTRSGLVKSSSGTLEQTKMLRIPSAQRLSSDGSPSNLSCMHTPNWEDSVSTCSFSEAEERTMKAVCEQMQSFQGDSLGGDTSTSGIYETVRSEVRRAIADIQNDLESAMRRSSTTSVQKFSVSDIPPDSVSPGAVELVLDIRREYAKKLEQSLERATKLRAELAVEEHRGLELSRILKEVLPDPKTPSIQKSRPGRKSSIERRKMSKRLTEEAMAYFDECVSLSTFDGSDFSSQEDPPFKLIGGAIPASDIAFLPPENRSISTNYCPNSGLNDKQDGWFTPPSQEAMELTATSSGKDRTRDQVNLNSTDKMGRKFSFGCRPSETVEFQKDIMKYVRNFGKDLEKEDIDSQIVTSNHFDVDEYNLRSSSQSFLFDRVFLRSRLESGNLLLCGGGLAISSSPFASII